MSVFRLPLLFFALLFLFNSTKLNDPYTAAYLKWDAGDYIGALEGMITILDGAQSDLYFDDIATLTGELYKIDKVAIDGRSPVFSSDNRHFSWQETNGDITVLKIGRVTENGTEVRYTIEGNNMVYSPDGRHGVFFRSTTTPRMNELQQQLSDAFQVRDGAAINRHRSALQAEQAMNTKLFRVDLNNGRTTELNTGNLMIRNPRFDADGKLWFAGSAADAPGRSDIYSMNLTDRSATRLTTTAGYYDDPMPVHGKPLVVFSSRPTSPFPAIPGTERGNYDGAVSVVLHHLQNGEVNRWTGQNAVLSRTGNRLAFQSSSDGENHLHSADLNSSSPDAVVLFSSSDAVQNPTLSPDDSKLAYMTRTGISWDVHMVHTADGAHDRLTYDIQHELLPTFLDNERVLAMMGEARHRRSHIYDVNTKNFYRLMHNGTVRTVSMEYEWEPSLDGNYILIVAQRDGNTIAPERGLYMVRVGEKVSHEMLRERLVQNLQSERDLRDIAVTMFAPIFDDVSAATREINITRLYNYQKSLYDFGSKHMTQPGNQKASEYIYETLKSFGYEPELQWFNPTGDVQTANVIARLEGTTHPEVVYILSSHFDSVLRSPGADDNTSGTSVLLEAARVMANNPQPATIIFASLTAEESGLMGAREFVRVADLEGLDAAGVVNNDMMGWTRHHRLDNTIRFSNYGIRDIQHSGAILFTDLITYDSRYYRNTDAHVFFDRYGDVLGGIGSYPILGNPNYHQTTDRLETINHYLVREVSKSTTATLMMLANAPSKVRGLEVTSVSSNEFRVSWNANREADIDHYLVRYRGTDGNLKTEQSKDLAITITGAASNPEIAVLAVNDRGIQGWDWQVMDR